MSRIDEALRKAGLVKQKDTGPDHNSDPLDAWDLDSFVEPSTADADGPDAQESSSTPQPRPTEASNSIGPTTPADLPATDFPGLSQALDRSFEDKLLAAPTMEFQSVEQFRRLAAALHLMQENARLKTLLVTSAVPSEGKTLTACNLALCLSGSYNRRVLLVDGDLRRPTIHEVFQVVGVNGLSDWLRSDHGGTPSIERVSKHLSILPAGRPDPDPMGVLTSPRMQDLLSDASDTVDWIILDSPPVGLLSDGHLLARMADAVVVVIRAAYTQYTDIQRTVDSLGRDRVAGVVLNQVDVVGGSRYDYGYQYQHSQTGKRRWLPSWLRVR